MQNKTSKRRGVAACDYCLRVLGTLEQQLDALVTHTAPSFGKCGTSAATKADASLSFSLPLRPAPAAVAAKSNAKSSAAAASSSSSSGSATSSSSSSSSSTTLPSFSPHALSD